MIRFFILASACSLGALAYAGSDTPEVVVKVKTGYQEDQPTKIYFFSPAATRITGASFCFANDCTPTSEPSIAESVVANKEGTYYRSDSLAQYPVKPGTYLLLDYSVDGNTSVYRRLFQLKRDTAEKSGVTFELVSDEVKHAGEAITLLSFAELVERLRVSGPDENMNGYADDFDSAYYGTHKGTCGDFAQRAYILCRRLGIPCKVVHYNRVDMVNYYGYFQQSVVRHAIIKAFVREGWQYLEPQLPGVLNPPSGYCDAVEFEPPVQ